MLSVFPTYPGTRRHWIALFLPRGIKHCCLLFREPFSGAEEAVVRDPGHLWNLSLPHGFLLGTKGEDATTLMASSLIRIEGWPPAPLMEGCENQADSSITLRAEPGQPRPNELGCNGAGEGQPEGPSQDKLHSASWPLCGLQRRGEEKVFNFVLG